MALTDIPTTTAPLQLDRDGVYRIGGTRVRLETVITAFQNGCTAEEILLKYPSLTLGDIYAVIAYYLMHREVVEVYFESRQVLTQETEREIEKRHPSSAIRERLLARSKIHE